MSIFERILAGEIPADKVYEDDTVLAFRDINPIAPVHVLIIPKKKAGSTLDLLNWSDEETGRYLKAAVKVARHLELEDDGYRFIINTGSGGGQTVPYLHIHLIAGQITGLLH
jgi:histidine triad (HIT) family protein